MPVLVAFSVVGVDMAASSRRRMLGEAPVARLARIKGSRDSERHAEAEEPQALGAEVGDSDRTGGALGRLAEVLLVRGKASTSVIPIPTTGVVHAWVGQILLNCDVFKRFFVRPTDTRVGSHDGA